MEKTEAEVQVEQIDVERAAKASHQQNVPSTRCLSPNSLLWIVVNVAATVTIVRKFYRREPKKFCVSWTQCPPPPPSPHPFA